MRRSFFILLILNIMNFTYGKNVMIPFEQNGKIGFVNEKFQIICYPEYSKIYNHSKYMFWVIKMNENNIICKNDIIFSDGTKLSLNDYKTKVKFIGNNFYVIYKNSESVVYNMENNEIVNIFKGYELEDSESEKYIFVTNIKNKNKSRYFYIDLQGNEFLTNNSYNRILSHDIKTKSIIYADQNWNEKICDFENNLKFNKSIFEIGKIGDGLFLGYREDEQGYFDLNGKLRIRIKGLENQDNHLCPVFCCSLIPCILKDNDIYVQEKVMEYKSKNWAIINTEGKVIKKNIEADFIFPFSDSKVAIMYKKINGEKKYSLLNTRGNVLTKKEYDDIREPINGYSRARIGKVDYLISTKNGQDYKVFEILLKNKRD